MRKALQIFFKGFFSSILSLLALNIYAQPSDSTIFRDDFNRTALGDFWQAAPSWSIVNGSAYNFIDGTGGTLRTSESYSQSSYIIETKASGFTGSYMREFRITFGQANLANSRMYVLTYRPYSGGILTLSRSTNNIYFPKTLDEVVLYPNLKSSQWYNFKIARYKSGLIQVYIDKGEGYGTIPLLETIDETYQGAGHIGWQVDTQTAAESFYVDWITAYTPSAEKPAVREKPLEDNLITQVSAKSKKLYKVTKLDTGLQVYTDRDYTITSVPSYLTGASFVQTAMNDKKNAADTFLTYFVKKDAIIYLGYDPRGKTIPAWLSKWTKTGDHIGTTDPGSAYFEVYSKLAEKIYPSPLFLGGNLANPASGSEANYVIAAIERPVLSPLQAEDAFLAGAKAANDHPGYQGTGFADYKNPFNDFIEWTVKIDVPGSYNLGFTYANGDSLERPLQIKDDGTDIALLPFSSTSSWSAWAFVSDPKANVFLTPGIHKIRATATGSSGPNMDELSLTYTSPSPPVTLAEKNTQRNTLISFLPDLSHKVYPNPFNESTNIYYTLKEKANVFLSVYSAQGQQIKLLVNTIQNAGNYQAPFNASEYSPGIYFYRLQIGDKVKVGKLIKK